MAVSAAVGLATAAGASVALGFSASVFFTAFAVGAGISAATKALTPKPNLGTGINGTTVTTRDPVGPRKLVYGKIRVGGNVVFVGNSGEDNLYLHLVVVFATHEIESYDEIWFNDTLIWNTSGFQGDWGTYVTIDRKFGTAGQAASSSLVSAVLQWTANHKLSGVAYIAFRLKFDQDKFAQGVPNITAVIRGAKAYDPRTQTTAYTQNPAVLLRHYMLDEKYGLGVNAADLNEQSFIDAANLCDEQVSLAAGGTQDRYQCNGVIDTTNQIKSNIENLLVSMSGRLVYSNGKFYAQGGEYFSPTFTFDESNIISNINTQTKQSRRDHYNGVKGTFIASEKNWKLIDYPSQLSSTYEAEDGDPVYLDLPLPFVTDNLQAQRLAKIALLKSRQQVTLSMSVDLSGLKVKIGDTIYLNNERLGYQNKVFEIVEYQFNISGENAGSVNLTLIETASAIYNWTTAEEQDFLAGGVLDLYDGSTVDNVTNLTATEIVSVGPDGTLTTSVELSWTAPNDAFIDFYKVRWNKVGTTDYFYAETKETRILITGLDVTSNYDFRVQVQNLLGVTSTGASLDDEVLEGDTTAPAVPTIIGTEGGVKSITLTWQNPSDADFKHVEVYVNTVDSIPATPTSTVDGESFTINGLIGEATRFFWLKSVDFTGNVSAATSSVSGTSVKVDENSIADQAISLTSFASGITPVQIVPSLPASADQGEIVLLTTDNKIYRYTGTEWTKATDGADITANSITTGAIAAGAISASEISVTSLASISSVLGTLTAGFIDASNVDIQNLTVNNLVGDVTEIDTFTAPNINYSLKTFATQNMVSIDAQVFGYRPFVTINATAQISDDTTVWGEMQMRNNVTQSKTSIGTVSASAAADTHYYYPIDAYVVLPATSAVKVYDYIGLTTDASASYRVYSRTQFGDDYYVYVRTISGDPVTTAPPTGAYSAFAQTPTWVTVSKSYAVERTGPSWKPMFFQGALPESTTSSVDVRVIFYSSNVTSNATATPPTSSGGSRSFGVLNIQGTVMLAR